MNNVAGNDEHHLVGFNEFNHYMESCRLKLTASQSLPRYALNHVSVCIHTMSCSARILFVNVFPRTLSFA
jgi:hypothetical protein